MNFFLLAPGNKDFVMTTSGAEKSNLLRRGFRDDSVKALYENIKKASYIHNNAGNGRVKLYRFYGSSYTDHLYTTNYNEGINAGYAYEGAVGYISLIIIFYYNYSKTVFNYLNRLKT